MDRRTERHRRDALAKNLARARAAGPTPLLACGCRVVLTTAPEWVRSNPWKHGFRKGFGPTWAIRGMLVRPECPVHGDEVLRAGEVGT